MGTGNVSGAAPGPAGTDEVNRARSDPGSHDECVDLLARDGPSASSHLSCPPEGIPRSSQHPLREEDRRWNVTFSLSAAAPWVALGPSCLGVGGIAALSTSRRLRTDRATASEVSPGHAESEERAKCYVCP